MKLRTAKKTLWITKTNGNETAEFHCEILTPRENLQIIDEVRKATRNRTGDLDGDALYRAKILRIDRTIIDWNGIEDENGNPLPCTSKNKELVYNFNRDLIDEILDEVDTQADIRNAEREDELKNSKTGLNG